MQESTTVTAKLDRWIFDSYRIGPYALALCRIFFAFHVLFFLFRPMNWIGTYPSIFFYPPPSLASFFSGFPPEWFFNGMNILAVFFFLGVMVGYHTRISSIGLFLVMFTYGTFAHSFGKIDHSILFTLFPLVMSFSNWGAVWSIDAAQGRGSSTVHAWPLALMATLIAFSMFTSGYYKLISGWLDTSTHATHSKVFSNVYAWQRGDLLAPAATRFSFPLFWELLDWLTVIWEMGFMVALFFPKIFRWFVGYAVFFHLGVLLLLNIDFSINLLVYTPFINWGKLGHALGSRKAKVIRKGKVFWKYFHPLFILPLGGLIVWVLYTDGCLWNLFNRLAGIEFPYLSGLVHLVGAALLVLFLALKRER